MFIPVRFNNGIEPLDIEITPKTFKELNLREADLEEFVRKNINLLFDDSDEAETLLIVGQQVRNSEKGVSDLTAIDSDGSIVLIELKRDLDDLRNRKEPFEFQAIRYAASYAKLQTPEELVDTIYGSYIERHKNEYDLATLTPAEMARRRLYKFLDDNDALKTFNQKQRIVLIAAQFDKQTLSAVAWLIANSVDIRCFSVAPVSIGESSYLEIERILPPNPLEEFYVDLSKPTSVPKTGTISTGSRKALPRMNKLIEWGILSKGDVLTLRTFDESDAKVIDDKRVEFNGEVLKYNTWGTKVTGWSSINIYEWAFHQKHNQTLGELRASKMNEIESQENETSN